VAIHSVPCGTPDFFSGFQIKAKYPKQGAVLGSKDVPF